jgi:hypothetical protein
VTHKTDVLCCPDRCVLMYGANGMFMEATWPGYETEEVEVDVSDEEDEPCLQVLRFAAENARKRLMRTEAVH